MSTVGKQISLSLSLSLSLMKRKMESFNNNYSIFFLYFMYHIGFLIWVQSLFKCMFMHIIERFLCSFQITIFILRKTYLHSSLLRDIHLNSCTEEIRVTISAGIYDCLVLKKEQSMSVYKMSIFFNKLPHEYSK